MRRALAMVVVGVMVAGPLFADAPARSILPMPRPVVPGTAERGPVASAGAIALVAPGEVSLPSAPRLAGSPRPQPRPDRVGVVEGASASAAVSAASTSAIAIAPMPEPRPRKGLFGFLKNTNATRTQPNPGAITGWAGAVCGVPGIKGRTIPPITSRITGCGVPDAVEITSVDGVNLSEAVTIDCDTAIALNTWVQSGAKPAVGRLGGGISGLRVAAHYTCRPRNNVSGAKISEHGKGKAIDIAAILLKNGEEMDVAGDYKRGKYSSELKTMYRAACGPFGTTLGPGSDGMHEDHLHFDTASYRKGPYCK